jgi:hypothetical protein
MRRRRGPGLLRTAAVVGTATAASGAVRHRQDQKYAAQAQAEQAPPPEQYAPAPPPPDAAGGDDTIEQLKQLAELHTSGVLSDEEFSAAKAKLLA